MVATGVEFDYLRRALTQFEEASLVISERPVPRGELAYLRYMSYDPDKAKLLAKAGYLAAEETFNWYDQRQEMLVHPNAPTREEAWLGEIEEQEKALEANWPQIEKWDKTKTKPWYKDSNISSQVMAVVGEDADVLIVGASILKNRGWTVEQVEQLWSRKEIYPSVDEFTIDYKIRIEEIRHRVEMLGMSIPEIVLSKLAINDLHYPIELGIRALVHEYGEVGKPKSWAKRTRIGVGDSSSQIPDMMHHRFLGETAFTVATNSPFGTNGSKPKAWEVSSANEVVVYQAGNPVSDETFRGLYRHTVVEMNGLYVPFHPHPESADYAQVFGGRKWKIIIKDLRERKEIAAYVVPTGSGYRYHGILALSEMLGKPGFAFKSVDDEISFPAYLSLIDWRNAQRDMPRIASGRIYIPNIAEYQAFVAKAKHSRLAQLTPSEQTMLVEHTHGGNELIMIAMDEIVLQRQGNGFIPIEKPKSDEEALRQIEFITSGEPFYVMHAAAVGSSNLNKMPAVGYESMPFRVGGTDAERAELASLIYKQYLQAKVGKGLYKLTPVGVTLMFPPTQRLLEVGKMAGFPEIFVNSNGLMPDHNKIDLLPYLKWERVVSQQSAEIEKIGIFISGLSAESIANAFELYFWMSNNEKRESFARYNAGEKATMQWLLNKTRELS